MVGLTLFMFSCLFCSLETDLPSGLEPSSSLSWVARACTLTTCWDFATPRILLGRFRSRGRVWAPYDRLRGVLVSTVVSSYHETGQPHNGNLIISAIRTKSTRSISVWDVSSSCWILRGQHAFTSINYDPWSTGPIIVANFQLHISAR